MLANESDARTPTPPGPQPIPDPAPASRNPLLVIGGFFLGGLAWGVVARAWMRFISPAPEFTWSGTLFIVTVFTVAATAQGVARVVRQKSWPRWAQTMVRVLAGLLALPLGAGAGIVMVPAMLTGSLALGRTDWSRRWRLAMGAVAAVNTLAMFPLLLEDLNWGRAILGWVSMVLVYALVVVTLSLNFQPRGDGWKVSRRAAVVVVAVIAVSAAALFLITIVGL